MEQDALDGFYRYCLTTAGEVRLKKVKWVIETAKTIIKKDLTKLKVDDVVTFLVYINQSKFSSWSKNDLKKVFKRFLKWQYKDFEMIEGNKVKQGFKTISTRKCMNREKINKNTIIKSEELEKLIRTAKTLKWKAIVSFAYESAFRPCEILVLRWKDLKFNDGLGICEVSLISPKTNDARAIPVKDCVVHLKRWMNEYQFPNRSLNDMVFPSQHDPKKPMGSGVISEMFKRLCKEAGIRHIYPYLLRHSRIYELQKKLPEKIVAKFSGHSIETSELYNILTDDDVTDTMLKQIYVTEELPPETKADLKQQIADLRKQINSIQENKAITLDTLQSFINSLSMEQLLKLRAVKQQTN